MKVSKQTITNTVVLAVALLNNVLAMLGRGTFDFTEDQIYMVVTVLFTVAAAARAWWKNNSFSKAAILADQVKNMIKEDGAESVADIFGIEVKKDA